MAKNKFEDLYLDVERFNKIKETLAATNLGLISANDEYDNTSEIEEAAKEIYALTYISDSPSYSKENFNRYNEFKEKYKDKYKISHCESSIGTVIASDICVDLFTLKCSCN